MTPTMFFLLCLLAGFVIIVFLGFLYGIVQAVLWQSFVLKRQRAFLEDARLQGLKLTDFTPEQLSAFGVPSRH